MPVPGFEQPPVGTRAKIRLGRGESVKDTIIASVRPHAKKRAFERATRQQGGSVKHAVAAEDQRGAGFGAHLHVFGENTQGKR